jgi:hypothetical protein
MLKFAAVAGLVFALSGCAPSAPNSAQACEEYFSSAERVDVIVDTIYEGLDTMTRDQRAVMATTYDEAIFDQAGAALFLSLALSSEGLGEGAFGDDVRDLTSLLRVQVALLGDAGTDVSTLVRIRMLASGIEDECKKIGASL